MATVTVEGSWLLEKYARLMLDKEVIPNGGEGSRKGGTWKDAGIQLTLLHSNHFMISSGTQIYESFSLWDAQKWIKGVNKGDSILFIYQLKDEIRRFRVKFSAQPPNKTPLEACSECITKLSTLLPIRDMGTLPSSVPSGFHSKTTSDVTNSQILLEDSQVFSQLQESESIGSISMQAGVLLDSGDSPMESELMPLSDLAKDISEDGKRLGKAYAETNFPVNQLGKFIRLCLTDSNFPGFVGAVEEEMKRITN